MLLVVDVADTVPWRKTLESLLRVTSFYWATVLFYCRTLGDTKINDNLRLEAVRKLTSIIYIIYERESKKQRQVRIVWPLYIATIETTDPIHKSWLLERLRGLRDLTSECFKLCSMAEEILSTPEGA
jgi:hypothetical protein